MRYIAELPLIEGAQRFVTTIGGIDFGFRLIYADTPEGGWVLDLYDADAQPLICGIPLVVGVNLLGQYEYLGLGFDLYAQGAVPNTPIMYSDLGTTAKIYVITAQP